MTQQNQSRYYKQLVLVEDITREIAGFLNLDELLQLILDRIVGDLGYRFSGIFLKDENSTVMRMTNVTVSKRLRTLLKRGIGFDVLNVTYDLSDENVRDSLCVQPVNSKQIVQSNFLGDFSKPYISERFSHFIQRATGIKILLGIPILFKDRVLGAVIVASKDEKVAETDKTVLQTFANQISIAIYNAKLFKQVQQQVTTLEQQTKDLDAMHEMSTLAGISLEKKAVLQGLLDNIPQKLGHLGVLGGAVLLDHADFKALHSVAYTHIEGISGRVLDIVTKKKKLKDITQTIKGSKVLQKVIKDREVQIFEDLYEVFPEMLKKRVDKAIKKITGVETYIMLPIISRDKVLGAGLFALKIPKEKIDERKKEILLVLVNHIAAALENANLYDQVREQYKQVEKQRKQLSVANIRLKELDKVKSEFISIASHQLRTPLTVIKGYLSLILEGSAGRCDETAGKSLEKVLMSTDRLVALVNDLLDISRIERGKLILEKRPTRLEEIIAGVVDELSVSAKGKGLELTFNKPSKSLPKLAIDPSKIRQVALNLIDNAIKYTPQGQIEVTVKQKGEEMHCIIKDTGIGIDPENMDKLFKKFSREEGVSAVHTEGVGLGLFVAKKIVEAHKGKIWVESGGKGRGSTFGFLLPIK